MEHVLQKGVSKHRMSLYLDKSGSYIRGISSGAAMPSVKELFNIIEYLGVSPSDFFGPLDSKDTPYAKLCERIRSENEYKNLIAVPIPSDWLL